MIALALAALDVGADPESARTVYKAYRRVEISIIKVCHDRSCAVSDKQVDTIRLPSDQVPADNIAGDRFLYLAYFPREGVVRSVHGAQPTEERAEQGGFL